ncbi:hypothetical protein BN2364_3437 [Alloalcanivorax xenomutans]|nr:hypothetical protein BN2364_3437 [Alloalcanivorax xenomutans]
MIEAMNCCLPDSAHTHSPVDCPRRGRRPYFPDPPVNHFLL